MSEEYIKQLQEKLKENPKDNETIEAYAIALSDIGENEEALKNFIYLKNIFPDNAKIYYNIGIILEKLKLIDDSVIAYEKALSLSEDDTDIMFNLANVYIKTENFDDAEKLLLNVIKQDKEDENAYFHLGEIYSRKKEYDKAIEYLTKALELDSSDLIAKFYLAYALQEQGNIEKAIALYQEITALNPDYSWAYYNLASIYLEKGDENQTALYLEKTIKTNPSDIKAVKMLTKLLCKQKKYSAAEKVLKQAMLQLPDEADICYLLAKVYKELKSRINYTKYLKLTLSKKITFSGSVEDLEKEIKSVTKA